MSVARLSYIGNGVHGASGNNGCSSQLHVKRRIKCQSTDGMSESTHGRSESTHGRSESLHGRSDSAYGRSDSPHGRSESPQGGGESPHGKSESPHGRNKLQGRAHLQPPKYRRVLDEAQVREDRSLVRESLNIATSHIRNCEKTRWDGKRMLFPMKAKAVKVGPSLIHKLGLFAKEEMLPEEFVIAYDGKLRQSWEQKCLEKEYLRKGIEESYFFSLNDGTMLDATTTKTVAKYLNHSCNPNLKAKIISLDGHPYVAFRTRRRVYAEEELTLDYKFELETKDRRIQCLCGSENCQGYLNYRPEKYKSKRT